MKRSFTIRLASPCDQKWETFQPTPQGAFCHSCAKDVVDFTKMTDQQIVEYFKSKPASRCGRFRPEQLATYPVQTETVNTGWRLWKAGAVALALAVMSKPSAGQTAVSKTTTSLSYLTADDVIQEKQPRNKEFNVTGIVKSLTDGNPLPGLTVQKRGTDIQAVTDVDGRFTFPVTLKDGDSLDFMFIGLKSQTRVITGNADQELLILMEDDVMQLGGYLMGGVSTRKISLRRLWWKIKNIF